MRFSLLRLLLPSLLVLRLIPVAHAQASIPVSELEAARAATERFGPEARVLWHPVRRVPAALLGLDVPVLGRTAEERATAFVVAHGELLGGIEVGALGTARVSTARGATVVHFELQARGVTIADRSLAVTLSPAGRVTQVSSDWERLEVPAPSRDVGVAAARRAAEVATGKTATGVVVKRVLAMGLAHGTLTYRVPVMRLPLVAADYCYVDFATAKLLLCLPATFDGPTEVVR